MGRLVFHKYQGLGNDFIVVDLRAPGSEASVQAPAIVRALCDRHFGIGADGVLAILPPSTPRADARMRVLNADGSEAEMCGNGIRCVACHLYPHVRRSPVRVETLAGVLACQIVPAPGGGVDRVAVEMGRPRLTRAEIPMEGASAERCLERPLDLEGERLTLTAVSMGNPHAVVFVDDASASLRALAERHGPRLERHPWFPRRTNVELARVVGPTAIELVVWERGCGITLACGTGACATAAAACLTGRAPAGEPIAVQLPGGTLSITVAKDLSGVTMAGPATLVFEGTIDLERLERLAQPGA